MEMRARRLSRKLSAKYQGRALVDLMEGMLLRPKAGVPREELQEDARSVPQLTKSDISQNINNLLIPSRASL
jgi:hypothetical protein